MSNGFRKPRGTKDILPDESPKWLYLEEGIRTILRQFNFEEIRTPTFEDTELFARGIGQTTDIVQKEMYTFQDNGGKSLTLRPEMTASVMRAYLEHHLGTQRSVQKLYYLSPMYRQERPQAGRFREFNQYGIEIIGTSSPSADAEAICLSIEIPSRLGVDNLGLKINSVGCKNCRPAYKKALQKSLKDHLEELCGDCQKRYSVNPMRILDCKKPGCRSLTEDVPAITDFLCDECAPHFDQVRKLLEKSEIDHVLDKRLVRGLDYYTKTAFEVTSDQLGSQDALCGGGRYDYLAEEIGGKAVSAVGFAAGVERLLTAVEKLEKLPQLDRSPDLYLIGVGAAAMQVAFRTTLKVRRAGIICEMDHQGRSLKAQMREANRLGSPLVAIIGESEMESNSILLKDMESGDQESISTEHFVGALTEKIRGKAAS